MGLLRSSPRIIKLFIFSAILLFCGYLFAKRSMYDGTSSIIDERQMVANLAIPSKQEHDTHLAAHVAQEEVSDKMVKATFVTLARNRDLKSLLESIRQVEDRFNDRYHYDWVFLNNEEFTEEFKEETSALASGKTKYGLIPVAHWSYPEWISEEKAALTREKMKDIIYGSSEPYRHMCRYEAGFFFKHDLLKDYDYYWRVDTDVKIFCDIDYDVFQWLRDNGKEYSFTISIPEYKDTIETLWSTVKRFINENPQYVVKNNLMDWISSDKGETYNGCHFWSNFEIGSLRLWRSEAYQKYFEYLDHAGGFFYERWGDAPVHSIAVALFLDKSKVHFFDDIGYDHAPFQNCPISRETRLKRKCVCDPKNDFTWKDYSCVPEFYTATGRQKPKGWENFAG